MTKTTISYTYFAGNGPRAVEFHYDACATAPEVCDMLLSQRKYGRTVHAPTVRDANARNPRITYTTTLPLGYTATGLADSSVDRWLAAGAYGLTLHVNPHNEI